MSIKINIQQPSFAPWIGFFEQIKITDIHCFIVDVQVSEKVNLKRTKLQNHNTNDYFWFNSFLGKHSKFININQIKTRDFENRINEFSKYFYNNRLYYPYYLDVIDIINKLKEYKYIYELNIFLIKEICKYFDFNDKKFFVLENDDSYYGKNLDKNDYLISIIKKYGAQEYITGLGARNYIDSFRFKKNDITLKIMDYKNSNYNKDNKNFIPYLSIMDLIGKRGKDGKRFINSSCKQI